MSVLDPALVSRLRDCDEEQWSGLSARISERLGDGILFLLCL